MTSDTRPTTEERIAELRALAESVQYVNPNGREDAWNQGVTAMEKKAEAHLTALLDERDRLREAAEALCLFAGRYSPTGDGGGDVSEPRTEAGRALLGLDVTPESGYWVNLSANEMRNAILAIEAEAARPSDDLTAAWARQEMEAQVRLRQTWFEAHPNQPMPEGRRWLAALSAEMPCLEDRGTDG